MLQQIQTKPIYIGTARFTTETYNENLRWKKKKEWQGACYGFDKKISTNTKFLGLLKQKSKNICQ